jgi:hypothetical protein
MKNCHVLRNNGYDVVQTFDSCFVICGSDGWFFNQWPYWKMSLIKTDKHGDIIWNYRYFQSIDNGGYSVQQTQDSGLVASGYSQFDGIFHAYLVRTNLNGEVLFEQTYAYQENNTWCSSVKECYDKGFVLCGFSNSPNELVSSLLIRTNNNGDTLWERIYGVIEQGKSVLCLPDSGFTLLSVSLGSSSYLRRLGKSGEISWQRNYTSIEGGAFKVTNEGGYVICGKTLPENPNQFGLLKTNQNGDSLWLKTYPYHAIANSVDVTFDGGYLIGGTIFDSPSSGLRQLFLLRTDENGDLLWTRKFGGSQRDEGNAIKTTNDTGFIFVGTTKKTNTDSIMVYLVKGTDDDTATGENTEQLDHKPMIIFPNPSNGLLNIQLDKKAGDVILEIRDLFGRCVFTNVYHTVKDVLTVHIPVQNSGIYLLSVKTQEYLKTKKILIQGRE